jgi:hypothetical protein
MAVTIKLRQGLKAVLPDSGMVVGEPLFATNTKELYIADSTTTSVPAAVDIAAFSDLGVVADGDLLYMYDVSQEATDPKARKITFGDFKTALNIPVASTDEKVATASGATAGYLGTNGADGVLRAGNGLSMTAGAENAFVTMALFIADQAQGDIIYRGDSAYARLGAGTAGGVLSTQGAAANPHWINTIDGGTFA